MSTAMLPLIFVDSGNIKDVVSEGEYHPNDSIVANTSNVFGKRYTMIPVTEILIDKRYQRIQTQDKVNALVRNWNEELYDPIKVTYRGHKFFANDGGKRLRAQIAMGRTSVVCQICDENTLEAEATRFIEQTKNVTRFRPRDTFKANILLGDPVDCTIRRVCDEYGVSLALDNSKDSTGTITDLGRTRNIVRMLGEDGLRWILSVIRECGWSKIKNGYSRFVLESLKSVYMAFEDSLDEASKTLSRVIGMSGISPIELRKLAMVEFSDLSPEKSIRNKMLDIVATGEIYGG